MTLTVAGEPVADCIGKLTSYARRYGRTLQRYDYAGPGHAEVLEMEEIVRTRVIASRISRAEANWLIRRSEEDAPWVDVPLESDLRSVDSTTPGSPYQDMLALYRHFYSDRPRGFSVAKLSKVLHLKRPGLYPILDSHLMKRYRRQARAHGRQRPELGRYQYWPAIRADLLLNDEAGAFNDLRRELSSSPDGAVRDLTRLTDLRLLDICSW